ncbi:hypothetical protein HY994_03970 [Candidatus Micrarchaeota archaeon]|nr:hypothetical protein [Candidatus Micrarchaeota archaeon]
MVHETVWEAFERHYPGRLTVSKRAYERPAGSLEEAKERFPPKAPARFITERIRTNRPGIGKIQMPEAEAVHIRINDAAGVDRLKGILENAQKEFNVVLLPRANWAKTRATIILNCGFFWIPEPCLGPSGTGGGWA